MKVYELNYIAHLAGCNASMGAEISKGRNLALYVNPKPFVHSWRWR